MNKQKTDGVQRKFENNDGYDLFLSFASDHVADVFGPRRLHQITLKKEEDYIAMAYSIGTFVFVKLENNIETLDYSENVNGIGMYSN